MEIGGREDQLVGAFAIEMPEVLEELNPPGCLSRELQWPWGVLHHREFSRGTVTTTWQANHRPLELHPGEVWSTARVVSPRNRAASSRLAPARMAANSRLVESKALLRHAGHKGIDVREHVCSVRDEGVRAPGSCGANSPRHHMNVGAQFQGELCRDQCTATGWGFDHDHSLGQSSDPSIAAWKRPPRGRCSSGNVVIIAPPLANSESRSFRFDGGAV